MITIWRPIKARRYRCKKGDVITLRGAQPEDVFQGQDENGVIIGGYAGLTMDEIFADFDPEDEPCLWTKGNPEGVKVRLALNKVFSEPLPLP